MNSIKELIYGNELTLKQQVELADDLLDVYITQLNDLLPDADLWMSGSVLYNSLSVGCSANVKIQLLGRKKILENIEKCSSCGRELDTFIKKWHLEEYIKAGKNVIEEAKSNA